jgi:hypothetical protein
LLFPVVMAVMTVVAALAIALSVLLTTGPAYEMGGAGEGPIVTVTYALIFCFVGGFLAAKRSENLVGWSMMFSGAGILVGSLCTGYAEYVLLAHPGTDAPLALEAASLGAGSWTFLMSGIFFLLVLFPSGQPSSKRWALIAKVVGVGFLLIWFTITTAPVDYEPPFEGFGRNRLAFHDVEVLIGAIFGVIFVCLLAILAAAIHLFLRFLRSRGQEREQFKWLAVSAVLLGISIPFSGTSTGLLSRISEVTFIIGLFSVPISIAIAITRYHLYDIDHIINRTLVYAVLTAGLGALYFGVVVGLQALLQPLSGGNDLAIVATTLMVAALFLPARRRVQAVVDRRFNRRAYDAALTVDAFSARLREHIDLYTLRYELLAVVDETMQPNLASLWVRGRNS